MNYHIKERLFSIGAKFDVYDQNNNVAFLVEADKFDIGKNITIYTPDKKNKLLHLRQKIRIGAHKYEIFNENDEAIGLVEKIFMVPEYSIKGTMGNLVMKSNAMFMARDYDIIRGEKVIGKISKEWTFGRDKYNLEVIEEESTVLLVGLLIIIDMVRYHSDN